MRHKAGNYYLRTFTKGKETFISLKTDVLEVARPGAIVERKDIEASCISPPASRLLASPNSFYLRVFSDHLPQRWLMSAREDPIRITTRHGANKARQETRQSTGKAPRGLRARFAAGHVARGRGSAPRRDGCRRGNVGETRGLCSRDRRGYRHHHDAGHGLGRRIFPTRAHRPAEPTHEAKVPFLSACRRKRRGHAPDDGQESVEVLGLELAAEEVKRNRHVTRLHACEVIPESGSRRRQPRRRRAGSGDEHQNRGT